MTQDERLQTIQYLEYSQALLLIYRWVKSEVINLVEFRELIQANRDTT